MTWKIPLFDLKLDKEEKQAVDDVLDSGWLSMGPQVRALEKEFAAHLGGGEAIAVSSGTAALHLACLVLDIGPGDEVICPAMTFAATVNAVLYTGARPVFADITSLDDFSISPESVRTLITPRTRAIVAMHYGGYPCALDSLQSLARKHDLHLIEDAAHAPGAQYKDRPCGKWGDVGCFSFFANKNMTCAEGGMLVCTDQKLADKARLLRSHGMTSLTYDRHQRQAMDYDIVTLGFNYRMDELRAALARVQLSRLTANNRKRQQITEAYKRQLKDCSQIAIPYCQGSSGSSCHLLPVLLGPDIPRQAVRQAMARQGIQTSIHYPALHLLSFFRKELGHTPGTLPLTEEVGKRVVTLPLYPGLSLRDVQFISNTLQDILRGMS